MEHAAGVQLHQKWPKMSGEQQLVCIIAICMDVKQMAAIEFPAYGSLYLADVRIEPVLKQPYKPGYVIGPHCGTYWDCNVGEARYYSREPSRGPCKHRVK